MPVAMRTSLSREVTLLLDLSGGWTPNDCATTSRSIHRAVLSVTQEGPTSTQEAEFLFQR